MTEGSLYEVLDTLLSNPNDGEITFNVNAVKEIRDELKNAEKTIARLMLEVNRLHGEMKSKDEIDIEAWARAQRGVADQEDTLMMLALPRKQWEVIIKCCEIALWHREKK